MVSDNFGVLGAESVEVEVISWSLVTGNSGTEGVDVSGALFWEVAGSGF
jgi:hypothetical protein